MLTSYYVVSNSSKVPRIWSFAAFEDLDAAAEKLSAKTSRNVHGKSLQTPRNWLLPLAVVPPLAGLNCSTGCQGAA